MKKQIIPFLKTLVLNVNKYKIVIIFSVVSLGAGYVMCWFLHSSYNSILKDELGRYSNGTWVVKVDGSAIGEKYLENRVRLYKEYIASENAPSDPLLRDKMLRKLIDAKIVLTAANKSRIFASNKAQEYLWIFLEESMINYYLDSIIKLKKGGGISLTESQIADFYDKNKQIFDKKNMKKKDALKMIKNEMNSINNKSTKEYSAVARRIELGKLKKGKKIIINKDILK